MATLNNRQTHQKLGVHVFLLTNAFTCASNSADGKGKDVVSFCFVFSCLSVTFSRFLSSAAGGALLSPSPSPCVQQFFHRQSFMSKVKPKKLSSLSSFYITFYKLQVYASLKHIFCVLGL